LNLSTEDLSDEQFLGVDIDAVVAGAHINARKAETGQLTGQKRKNVVVSTGIKMGIEEDDMITCSKRKKKEMFIKKKSYILSSSDSETEDKGGVNSQSDIEDDDHGRDSGYMNETNIRTRNKGKSQQGGLSLNTRKSSDLANKKRNYVEMDLTTHELEVENNENSDKEFVLDKKQTTQFHKWFFAFRRRYYKYWLVLNNNTCYVSLF
jgi:hypothetical protein